VSLLKLLGDGRRRQLAAEASRERRAPVARTLGELEPDRREHEQLRLRREQIIVSDLFSELRTRFQPRATPDGRLIAVERTSASVFADLQRVRQALSSLIENALGHGAGDICLLADQLNGLTRLHVRDHGRGFPHHVLAHVFEPPRRADSASDAGRGLSTVQTIASALGGQAHAGNAASGGAHVWLELPARPTAD